MADRYVVPVGNSVVSPVYDVDLAGEHFQLHQTLLYLGQDGSCFRLGYRERLSTGASRDPFREDATYQNPMPGIPTAVIFRNASLIVHSVSNTEIEFEILRGDDRI